MFSTRRRVAPIGEKKAINGLYVHSSPPRVLNVNSAHIRHLIRTGDLEKLEQLVLDGQGRKLLGEYSADYKTRTFLKSIPALMAKVNLLHDAVSGGSLEELQNLLQEDCSKRKKMVLCKDQSGVGLLHKAIYYDLSDIAKWLIENYPQTASVKDAEGRTPAHYIAMCKDPREMQRLLTVAGADLYATDSHGRNYKYYMENPGELELPSSHKLSLINGTSKSATAKDSLVIKPSNIRIWIHQRDLGRLQKVLWEGHGSKLRTETSNNSRVKRFLEAVPHLMGAIKEIHTAAVNKDLQLIRDRTSEPVPPVILSSKDANGLGHMDIAKFILEKFPKMANAGDAEGRTPLHYAAILKDGDEMYNMLIGAGAEESSLDNRQKTAAYYKTRPNEIDSRLLQVIPDAPRTATTTFPSSWDWNLLTATTPDESAKSKKSDKLFGSTPTADKNIAEEIKSGNSPQEEHAPAEENGKDAQEEPEEKHEVHENGHGGNEKDEPEVKEKEEIKENGTHEKNDEEEEEKQDEKEKETDHEDIKKSGNEDVKENGNEDPKENKNNDPKENKNEEPKENENEKSKENENEKSKENVNEKSKENGIEHHEENNEVLSKQNEHNDTQDSTDKHVENTEEEHKPEETHHKDSEDNLKKEDDEKTEPKTNGEHHEVDEADDVVTESKDREHKEEHDHEKKPDTPDSQKVGVIEGVVNGKNEVETLNNDENNEEANGNHDDDAEVTEMVESGNMEQLAALVLNGEGERLIGKHSQNPETQAFLENVPIYMSKTNRVHIAARDGSLRDLQAALDRRKFAIAKDQISPNGASPLHVATIFGNTSIVRYLAGRFPETVQTEDDNGRTPLHYAATLADNGHYYNLLLHLGANASHQDKFGHDAEYYQTNQEDFSHRQLLHDFGAKEELVEEMLNDKDPTNNTNTQVDIPLFRTEEGRYLASSLGDPLIKGLTEVANKRPEDPIAYLATYLYNFANNNKGRIRTQESKQMQKPETPETKQPTTIDVVTLDPEQDNEDSDTAFSASARDEHGQSMLHFAAARAHGRNALFQLLQDTDINIGYRDELYRTARDVTIQANVPENTVEIDRYVISIAAKGDTDKLVELLMEGYDHIIDIVDEDNTPILQVVQKREQTETMSFLHSILAFEERRERVHHAIRQGAIDNVREMLADENETGSGKLLAIGKNSYGRCTLHIAVLCQQEEIVDYIANAFPDTLHIGDNLERTALHYAMGIEKVEPISRVLIEAGAKRVMKDLKGRQASYYFMNKSDILRLQEEEETF